MNTEHNQADLTNQLMNTKQSASFLNVAEVTLRNSRVSGLLCGVKAPIYRKIGRKVVYLRSDLIDWFYSLPASNNTAESGEVA